MLPARMCRCPLLGMNRPIKTSVDGGPFGLIANLASLGCFGPFPCERHPTTPVRPTIATEIVNDHGLEPLYDTGGTFDKRRRIHRSPSDEVPPNQRTIDLNRLDNSSPTPEHLSEPQGNPEIHSAMDEAQRTVEIGQIIGSEIENGDPILMEVMEENGEIPIVQ